jgi:hypothetical protein
LNCLPKPRSIPISDERKQTSPKPLGVSFRSVGLQTFLTRGAAGFLPSRLLPCRAQQNRFCLRLSLVLCRIPRCLGWWQFARTQPYWNNKRANSRQTNGNNPSDNPSLPAFPSKSAIATPTNMTRGNQRTVEKYHTSALAFRLANGLSAENGMIIVPCKANYCMD